LLIPLAPLCRQRQVVGVRRDLERNAGGSGSLLGKDSGVSLDEELGSFISFERARAGMSSSFVEVCHYSPPQ
jgi:hypothetical protein